MRVVIYGANGWTGTLLAKTLDRRGHHLVLAGRNEQKLHGLRAKLSRPAEVRVADARDAAALANIFRGADVVVPCAGPYKGLAETILEVTLASGCHYFDVSGEYDYVRYVYDRYDDAARRRNLTFCPGFAAKGILGDWCATLAAREGKSDIEEITIAYSHTLLEYLTASPSSFVSAAAQGLFNPRDRYDPKRGIEKRIEFPPPFGSARALLVPMTDEVTIPRHIETPIVRNYLAVAPGTPANDIWATFFTTQLPAMPGLAKWMLANPQLFKTMRDERVIVPKETTFAALAEVKRPEGRTTIGVTMNDAYQASADLIAFALDRLASAPRGALTPSEFCEPRAAMRQLSRALCWTGYRRTDPR